MSTHTYKTKYNVATSLLGLEEKTLYAKHYDSLNIVIFYDEEGNKLFTSHSFIEENSIVDAINRLYIPRDYQNNCFSGVQHVDFNERQKLK